MYRTRLFPTFVTTLLLLSGTVSGQSLTGDALRQDLHQKAKSGHDPIFYSAARGALEFAFRDPDNLNNVLLFYTGRSQDADIWVNSDGRDGWNREHLWPQSRGMGGHPMKGDLHNLRPTDASVNKNRDNLNFDVGGAPEGEAPGTFLDGDSFEPRDAVKGDVARAVFYVDVRYEGTNGEPDLELVDASVPTGGHTLGDLCTLLDWHIADPVTPEEVALNDAIEGFQGNRNPFIDDPQQAIALYGPSCGMDRDQAETDGRGDTSVLRLATWNIANLHHESGVALRGGAVARDDIDYTRLAELAETQNWDIVALQEIGSPNAARRIFPADKYHLVMSDRYETGAEDRPAEERDIYTAMVFSKEVFPTVPNAHSFPALSIDHVGFDRDGTASVRPTRSAIIADLTIGGEDVRIMGVHLKSSCHGWSLDPATDQSPTTGRPFSSRFHCRTLAAQRAILENWIEQQAAIGVTTMVLGDFNRRFNSVNDQNAPNDDFWLDLNDGTPNNLSLAKGPEGTDATCWPNHNERFEDHIDFVVHDVALGDFADLTPAKKITMGHETDSRYAGKERQKLSDHCPVEFEIRW